MKLSFSISKTFFFILLAFSFTVSNVHSQEDKFKDWYPNEIQFYKNLIKLAEYTSEKPGADFDISKNSVIQKFLFINESSKDSIYKNTVYSIEYKNELFNTYFTKTIDKHGLENLDAKPLRFYKQTDSVYRPFVKSLKEVFPFVMVYYLKGSPEKPLGTLAFDPKTLKLSSWILLSQGGSAWYYL